MRRGRSLSYIHEELDWRDTGDENYLVRHWKGHLPLPVSYWVNGIVIPFGLTWGGELALTQLGRTDVALRWLMMAGLVYLAFASTIWVWSMVGIWRSAGYHEERGGNPGWANFARFLVVISALGAVGQMHNRLMFLVEASQLALGQDPIGTMASFSVERDGKSALLDGNITAGAAEKFGSFLAAHPSVQSADQYSRALIRNARTHPPLAWLGAVERPRRA